jgi:hypothetical protein
VSKTDDSSLLRCHNPHSLLSEIVICRTIFAFITVCLSCCCWFGSIRRVRLYVTTDECYREKDVNVDHLSSHPIIFNSAKTCRLATSEVQANAGKHHVCRIPLYFLAHYDLRVLHDVERYIAPLLTILRELRIFVKVQMIHMVSHALSMKKIFLRRSKHHSRRVVVNW